MSSSTTAKRYIHSTGRFAWKKSIILSIIWLLVILIILFAIIYFSKLESTEILLGFVASFSRIVIAYVIALILSVVIALLITSTKKIEDFCLPIFDVLQSFPSFALFPAMVIAIRSSEVVIILVLVITIVWPILFTIIGNIKDRREDLEEAATIFGAKGLKRLQYFTLPSLLPSIVTGSIVGWGEGWEFIIGAELLVNVQLGIGKYLGQLGNNQQNILLVFGIVVLMLILFTINKFLWIPILNKVTMYQSE